MTHKSFWQITVKIFGLILILRFVSEGFQALLNTYQFARFYSQGSYSSSGFDFGGVAAIMIYYGIALAIYLCVIRLCLFKTDWVVDKLGLARDQEEEKIEFNIHRSIILKIAIIVAGAFFMVSALPPLFTELLTYFQHAEAYSKFTSSNEAKYIVTHLVEVFLGYFMLTCSRMIVNFIELKRKDGATANTYTRKNRLTKF